ncbi:hypothetical protein HF521_022612 [Silurus meridionalis]|uniref:Uncharacterized protein n=1 Tax=Silurus meridionalis TaxID=175797 RepID=A0A8T0B9Y0_SILME|nr:hypothetical protein HF521_022612 [Silurus meridionalis]
MSLSEVENPWKGISLNRCIVLAIAIVVLISGVEMVQGNLKLLGGIILPFGIGEKVSLAQTKKPGKPEKRPGPKDSASEKILTNS